MSLESDVVRIQELLAKISQHHEPDSAERKAIEEAAKDVSSFQLKLAEAFKQLRTATSENQERFAQLTAPGRQTALTIEVSTVWSSVAVSCSCDCRLASMTVHLRDRLASGGNRLLLPLRRPVFGR